MQKDNKIIKKVLIAFIISIIVLILSTVALLILPNHFERLYENKTFIDISKVMLCLSFILSLVLIAIEIFMKIIEIKKGKVALNKEKQRKRSMNSSKTNSIMIAFCSIAVVLVATISIVELMDAKEEEDRQYNFYNPTISNTTLHAPIGAKPNKKQKELDLFSLPAVEYNNWKTVKGSKIDSDRVENNNSTKCVLADNKSFGSYYIKGNFSQLEIEMRPHESMKKDCRGTITIYNDSGKTLLSQKIDGSNELITNTVAINDSRFITIKVEGDDELKVLLMNTKLS